jgi:hypothetical protein
MMENRESQEVRIQAHEEFNDAYQKGFWRSVLSWITKNKNELLPFDEIRKVLPIKGQHYIGVKEVPVNQIVGSVNRYHDFDRAFLPRQTHTRDRWENIDVAHLQDVILPPIEVFKIGELYFVKDGNHRVSVARQKGASFIDALVIELDIPVSVTPDMDVEKMVMLQEESEFLEQTRLSEFRPRARIQLSICCQYQKLMEHIQVHRWFLGEESEREISIDEAVLDWYDSIYEPLARIIRKKRILDEFPDRNEADLYLWIIEHRWYLQEEYQHEVSLEAAARHFVDQFTQRPVHHRLQQVQAKIKKWFRKKK